MRLFKFIGHGAIEGEGFVWADTEAKARKKILEQDYGTFEVTIVHVGQVASIKSQPFVNRRRGTRGKRSRKKTR